MRLIVLDAAFDEAVQRGWQATAGEFLQVGDVQGVTVGHDVEPSCKLGAHIRIELQPYQRNYAQWLSPRHLLLTTHVGVKQAVDLLTADDERTLKTRLS